MRTVRLSMFWLGKVCNFEQSRQCQPSYDYPLFEEIVIAVGSLRSSQRRDARFDTFLGERGKFDAALHGSTHFGPAYCNRFAIDGGPSTPARKACPRRKSPACGARKESAEFVRGEAFRIRRRGSLPDLPRGDLQRLGERRALAANVQGRRDCEARLRGLSRWGCQPRC